MEVPQGTAYIRSRAGLETTSRPGDLPDIMAADERDSSTLLPRIWDLLRTPQTVETVCRVLTREQQISDAACRGEVTSVFAQLLEADLIEISPDA